MSKSGHEEGSQTSSSLVGAGDKDGFSVAVGAGDGTTETVGASVGKGAAPTSIVATVPLAPVVCDTVVVVT